MRMDILEEIGLTKSEINVYLALLELGSSSTGKIVDKSKAASSKIYEILDKLIQKGLVSFIIKSGIKYFEAAPPERIMDYMEEKENKFNQQKSELKKILPELELKQRLSKFKSEATIFKGLKGAETAFKHMINSMTKEDEWLGFVASFKDRKYADLLGKLHTWRSKKGLKSRIIFNERSREDGKLREKLQNTKVKYVPDELQTPAVINVAGNITLLNIMAEEVTVFMIENREVADSFRNQFERLWEQKVYAYEGQDSVEKAYKNILDNVKPDDDTIIFAAKPTIKRASDYNFHWIGNMNKIVKRSRAIYYGDNEINRARTKQFESQGCKTKIIPTKQTLPISTVVSGNKILNVVWGKHPSAFMLDDKIVADSFRENFELIWNQETRVVKGLDAIQNIFEEMLEAGSCDFIGARGYFVDLRPRYIDEWEKRAVKKGFKMRNIVDIESKGHRITKFPFVKTKYTLPKEFSQLSVFWIYGNKVAISNWMEKEPIVLIIDNKNLHDMYKQQFELLWKKEDFWK